MYYIHKYFATVHINYEIWVVNERKKGTVSVIRNAYAIWPKKANGSKAPEITKVDGDWLIQTFVIQP